MMQPLIRNDRATHGEHHSNTLYRISCSVIFWPVFPLGAGGAVAASILPVDEGRRSGDRFRLDEGADKDGSGCERIAE